MKNIMNLLLVSAIVISLPACCGKKCCAPKNTQEVEVVAEKIENEAPAAPVTEEETVAPAQKELAN